MAFAHVASYSAQNKTAAFSKAFAFNYTDVAGRLYVLVVALDNMGTNGAAPTVVDIRDAGPSFTSFDYLLQHSMLTDPGAAGDGAYVAIYSWIGSGLGAISGVVVQSSESVTAGAVVLHEFTVGIGALTFTQGTTGAGVACTVTPSAVGDLVVGGWAEEGTTAGTGDSDTTGGSWSTAVQNGTSGGSATTNMRAGSQYKIVTSTVQQSWLMSGSGDQANAVISINEASAADRHRMPSRHTAPAIHRAVM